MKLSERLPAIFVISILVLGLGMLVLRLFGSEDAGGQVSLKIPALSSLASKGKSAFEANCAQCHGTNGAGGESGPPLVHDIYNPGHHCDAAFFRAAKQGTPRHHWTFGDMPPQPQVSEQDVAAIVRYVRELQEANGIRYRPHRM
jgi:mono/diheme cytochrome c family protein